MKLFQRITKRRRVSANLPSRPRFPLLNTTAVFFVLLFFFFVVAALYTIFLSVPSAFPTKELLTIKKGSTLLEVSEELEEKHYVQNALVFQWVVMLSNGEQSVVAGSYSFKHPQRTFALARRLTMGDYGLSAREVTIPEGFTVRQIAERMAATFPHVSKKEFIALAEKREGFLFPDTYEFFLGVNEQTIIQTMRQNFHEKAAPLKGEIRKDPEHTLREVIIMASILEEEAQTTRDRRIVAGILWHRISIGMPLQVDATFKYLLGKTSYELTLDDLKIKSPYNTYLHKGLPIGPISNPGLDAIKAAMHPIKTEYLFYLSDKKGNLHYGETLEEHQRLKNKYVN